MYVPRHAPDRGARSEGIRILRSRADARALRLLVEGRNGRSYDLFLRTPREPGAVEGATLVREGGRDPIVRVTFDGPEGDYSRRKWWSVSGRRSRADGGVVLPKIIGTWACADNGRTRR